MSKLIVLKLGGSVITKKEQGKQEVNQGNLDRLAQEVAKALSGGDFRLIIVHGAGPFGHVLAKEYGFDGDIDIGKRIEGFSRIHHSMGKLNVYVVGALQKEGVNAIEFQPSAGGVLSNKKLVILPLDAVKKMIERGMVPVGYGDVLVDLETGVDILSGDHLVPYLAKELKADQIVIATDVPGIFNGDPKTDKSAKPVKVITPETVGAVKLGKSKAIDVTGGMKRKVDELLESARLGIESEVVSALEAGHVKRALLGEKGLGTTIKS